ncbi:hypothetical protein BDW02DRAFT_498165 [Decorospora gaudefroyi]|uniref:Heterokaryon incompatibility domain-containing protein n=1 Tax=Decorospora gaudefroyi TaxID=184978 RepID=A0A6A5KLS6_9PLEO|nr:hypothetical protein BDW02DRAFT_498165 [Decorospora gaudefroyi]
MPEHFCTHRDIRKFDGIRCCLECGETVFEAASLSLPSGPNDTHNSDHYMYTKLNYKLGQEIRLVVLLPGQPADPIRCDIVHENLEDDPEYDAVSYVWATENGDVSFCKSIQIRHGGSMPITANCDAALRQLRHRGLPRRVWIDAICIDQTNIEERNHQVYLMSLIYSRARSVRICIQERSSPARLLAYSQLFKWLQGVDVEDSREFQTLQRFVSLRYFRRVWVIQEVALANLAYLLFNDEELLLTGIVMERLKLLCITHEFELPGALRWNFGQTGGADVLTCIYAGMNCNATDARDKIFAVLSLMEPHARSLIPVDYSLSLESVYTNTILAIMTTERNLQILFYASIGPSLSAEDWRTVPCMDMQRFQQYLIGWSVAMQPPSQSVQATRLDQFEGVTVGSWHSTIDVHIVPSVDNYKRASSHESMSCIVEWPQPTRPDFLPRFWVRAHYIDRVEDMHTFSTRIRSCSETCVVDPEDVWIVPFFSGEMVTETPPTYYFKQKDLLDLRDYLMDLRREGAYSQPFSTRYSVGFATPRYQRDDAIFAIDGVRTPMLLRKTDAQSYRVVGYCYLWAALELDCWNPGTKKGRWKDLERPSGLQTQMIEIH